MIHQFNKKANKSHILILVIFQTYKQVVRETFSFFKPTPRIKLSLSEFSSFIRCRTTQWQGRRRSCSSAPYPPPTSKNVLVQLTNDWFLEPSGGSGATPVYAHLYTLSYLFSWGREVFIRDYNFFRLYNLTIFKLSINSKIVELYNRNTLQSQTNIPYVDIHYYTSQAISLSLSLFSFDSLLIN